MGQGNRRKAAVIATSNSMQMHFNLTHAGRAGSLPLWNYEPRFAAGQIDRPTGGRLCGGC